MSCPIGRTGTLNRSTSICTSTTLRARTPKLLRSGPGCCRQPPTSQLSRGTRSTPTLPATRSASAGDTQTPTRSAGSCAATHRRRDRRRHRPQHAHRRLSPAGRDVVALCPRRVVGGKGKRCLTRHYLWALGWGSLWLSVSSTGTRVTLWLRYLGYTSHATPRRLRGR